MAVCTDCGKEFRILTVSVGAIAGSRCDACYKVYFEQNRAAREERERQEKQAIEDRECQYRDVFEKRKADEEQRVVAIAKERAVASATTHQLKYGPLRSIVDIYRVLAWICGIGTVINVVASLALESFALAVTYLVVGFWGTVGCVAIAELIIVFLDIEENTRNSYSALWRLLKSTEKPVAPDE